MMYVKDALEVLPQNAFDVLIMRPEVSMDTVNVMISGLIRIAANGMERVTILVMSARDHIQTSV